VGIALQKPPRGKSRKSAQRRNMFLRGKELSKSPGNQGRREKYGSRKFASENMFSEAR